MTQVVLAKTSSSSVLSDIDRERIGFIVGTELYPDSLTKNQDFGLQEISLAAENTGGVNLPEQQSQSESARRRIVEKGETLSGIASEYDLSSYDFLLANPAIKSRDAIVPGMSLIVPQGAASDEQVQKIKQELAEKEKQKAAALAAASKSASKSASKAKSAKSAVEKSVSAAGSYSLPVHYKYISQHFMENGHTGVDFACDVGSTVRAAASGVVVRADASGWNGGYGNVILIKHSDDSYSTLYGHLSKVMVKEGEAVEAGEAIGLSGNTGRSTGPHLHFEVRSGGSFLNPLRFL